MSKTECTNVAVPETCDCPEIATERELPTSTPRVDIRESEDEFILDVEMPGVTREGVELRFERERLRVEGRVTPRPDERDGYRRREFRADHFSREFRVGETVDPAGIEARMNGGLLTVRLPKKSEAKSRTIAVD